MSNGRGLVTVEIVDEDGGELWSFLRTGLAGKMVYEGIKILKGGGWKIGPRFGFDGVWVSTDSKSIRLIQEGSIFTISVCSVED